LEGEGGDEAGAISLMIAKNTPGQESLKEGREFRDECGTGLRNKLMMGDARDASSSRSWQTWKRQEVTFRKIKIFKFLGI
jgi:hypothetical protein